MGRGRAKAKQTKVARELKYFSPDTDLSALERELHGSTQESGAGSRQTNGRWGDDEEDDGYESWAAGRH